LQFLSIPRKETTREIKSAQIGLAMTT
jgi:hypothetical protein